MTRLDVEEAARTLALYWERSRDPMPIWVARGPVGEVLAWSRSKPDAMRRAPDHRTCEREHSASGPLRSPADIG